MTIRTWLHESGASRGVASRLAGCLCLLGASAAAQGREFPVQTHTLANGMKILVHEDHSTPSAALYIFYRIGSRNERPGVTGISHFFEHMMFNGAKKFGPKQFDRTMEAAGGQNNAYTDCDVTVYQDWFPPSALDMIFDLEGDRIANLSFDPKLVESERGVIMSERRASVDASTSSTLDEQLRATAYLAHPYQWPVIGWMCDIESWKLEDLKRHFDMGYSPANATMVVCGDITMEAVLASARKHIEPIPSREPPPPVTTREPEQTGERRVKVERFAQMPILMAAYHIPESRSRDYPALRVLENILLSGQSSRLYQRLVDKDQLAISVEGGFSLAMDPTLFIFSVQPKEGVDTLKIEAALYEELGRIGREEVTPRELQKAHNVLLADHYRQLKTINGKAQALGNYEVFFGGYKGLFDAPSNYAQITAGQVRSAAAQYFKERNRTVATLIPKKEDNQKP